MYLFIHLYFFLIFYQISCGYHVPTSGLHFENHCFYEMLMRLQQKTMLLFWGLHKSKLTISQHVWRSEAIKKHCVTINIIESWPLRRRRVGHVFVCQVTKCLWPSASHFPRYHWPAVSNPRASQPSVPLGLLYLLWWQRGKKNCFASQVTYPTARVSQNLFKQIWTPQVMPLSIARGFPDCPSDCAMLFWGTTHSSSARINTSCPQSLSSCLCPPGIVTMQVSKRLAPGVTCCLRPKYNVINNKREWLRGDMEELMAC